MKGKPEIGQTLYMLNVGNAARGREQVLTPVTVVKIGKKYFSVREPGRTGDHWDIVFHLEGWSEKTEYSTSHVLYSSEQEWLDEKETESTCRELWKCFEYGHNNRKLSLGQLRRIKAIVEEKPV